MKNLPESLLSFAETELVHKESIRRAALAAQPEKQRRPIAWTKILLPIAACLVLLIGTVLLVPQARAEVQRWFGMHSPEQYLTEDPENRGNEQIDSLIVPPVTDAPICEQVTYVCDEPIWQQIARDFRIDLGDTMYDGSELYITVTLHGLTALPELDAAFGGSATQVRVPLSELSEYFERGKVPTIYTNGQASFFEETRGSYFLQFADGRRLSCGSVTPFSANPDYQALQNEHFTTYGDRPLSDAQREEISKNAVEWLKNRELIGVVQCPVQGRIMTTYADDWNTHPDLYRYENVEAVPYLLQFADENGMVNATLVYRTGSDVGGEARTLLEATLGTVRFDLGAVERMDRKALSAETPSVTLGSQTIRLSYSEWVEVDYGDGIAHAVTNLPSDLNGLTLSVEDGGYLDALGIHNVQIKVATPEGWTEQQRSAFFSHCDFPCEIEGRQYRLNARRSETVDGKTKIYTLNFTSIPYDRIDAIQSIRIVPHLFCTEEMVVGSILDGTAEYTPMQDYVRYIHPDTDENVSFYGNPIALSDGTLTLSVQP